MSTSPTHAAADAAPIHPEATANRVAKAKRVIDFINANPKTFGPAFSWQDASVLGDVGWKLINQAMDEPREMSDKLVTTIIGIMAGIEMAQTDTELTAVANGAWVGEPATV